MTPFYDLALKLFTRTQKAQIQKGIEKYPNTFNPREWTPEELLNHALEETVDLTHYLVGLKVLLDDRDKAINMLKKEKERLIHEIELLKGELSQPSNGLPGEMWNPLVPKRLPANFEGKVVGTPLYKKPSYADLDDE